MNGLTDHVNLNYDCLKVLILVILHHQTSVLLQWSHLHFPNIYFRVLIQSQVGLIYQLTLLNLNLDIFFLTKTVSCLNYQRNNDLPLLTLSLPLLVNQACYLHHRIFFFKSYGLHLNFCRNHLKIFFCLLTVKSELMW